MNDELVESLRNDKNFRDLKHWIRRVLVKENNIKLLEFHLNNETTPSQLFFDKFPTPFLNFDSEFVEAYNNIIKNTQRQIITESIKRLKIQIEFLKNNIQNGKTHFDSNIIDDLIDYLYKTIQKEKEKEFLKAHEKATKIVARPFIARQNFKQINKQNVTIGHISKKNLKNKDNIRSRNDTNNKRNQTIKYSNSNNSHSNYAFNEQTRVTNSNKITDSNNRFRHNRQESFYKTNLIRKNSSTDYKYKYNNRNYSYSRQNKIHGNYYFKFHKILVIIMDINVF